MRWLEVRRHSFTKHDESRGRGSHLSAAGVVLAREVGSGMGAFTRVATSPLPRAIETAIAMGFAVDDVLELPSGYVSGEVEHHDQWTWERPYLRYAELVAQGRGLARVAAAGRRAFVALVNSVPDGAAALVISHGGTIEPVLVACLPEADHGSWGACFGHCDGARLAWDGNAFVAIEIHRAAGRAARRRSSTSS